MGRLYSLLGKQDYYVIRAGDSKRGEAGLCSRAGHQVPSATSSLGTLPSLPYCLPHVPSLRTGNRVSVLGPWPSDLCTEFTHHLKFRSQILIKQDRVCAVQTVEGWSPAGVPHCQFWWKLGQGMV
jgi:hypothetical protein